MKQAILDDRIHQFLARKEQQFPELHQSVGDITSELLSQERIRQVNRVDRSQSAKFKRNSSIRFGSIHYAL